MRRLTTPTQTFTFPEAYVNKLKKVLVTYSQKGEDIINKTELDGEVVGNKFIFSLTQEETKRFVADEYLAVQFRALTEDDKALASDTYYLTVEDVLNDEVLG